MAPFEVFRETMGGIVRDQVKHLHAQEELLRIANEAFFATRSVPEQARYLAQAVVNGQYAVRIRDDSRLVHQVREDARALRRTLVALAAAAVWLDHRRQRR
jgi:Txe/YoeB family toxin of Txe-Axe toxin-antitoxin module